MQRFDALFPHGAPSLVGCERLEVRGEWTFGRGVVVRGAARVSAEGSPGMIPDGTVLGG